MSDKPIAFQSTGGSHSVDASEKTFPTLKVGSGLGIPSPPAIAFHHTQTSISGGVSPALSKNADGMGVMTGAQAWDSLNHKADDVVATSGQNTGMATGRAGVVSVNENQRGEVYETSVGSSLGKGGGKPGQGYPAVRDQALVRRLTPVECERLQGWPDGWTLVEGPSLVNTPRWFEDGYEPNEEMPPPDGRRYAACGDGVTATVAEWIGRRIMKVVNS